MPWYTVFPERLFSILLNSNVSISKFHYGFTTSILAFFALLNGLMNYFGNAVTCVADSSLNDIIDTYCSNIQNHTIPESDFNKIASVDLNMTNSNVTNYRQNHRWIFFMLLFQTLCFYIPHYIAKMFEGDIIETINPNSVAEIQPSDVDGNESNQNQRQRTLYRKKRNVEYFVSNLNTGIHNVYANVYVFCEVLNLGNVLTQLYLTNYFFFGNGNEFANPKNILNLLENPKRRTDLLARSLPQFTKCDFYKPGPGGSVVIYEAECVLAINSTNQLTMVVLSYWFCILIIFSVLALVSRLIVRFKPQIRKRILKDRSQFPDDKQQLMDTIFQKCHYADWFVLHQLKKHCDSFSYREFVKDLGRKITD